MIQIEEVVNAENFFCLGNALLRQLNILCLDIDLVILVFLQSLDKTIRLQIQISCLFLAAGNNQRRTGFIDQNGVNFIYEGEVQTSQNSVFNSGNHVVTQIIETKFRVGCISNITCISCPLLRLGKLTQVDADGQSQPLVNGAHPFTVTL